MDRVQTYLLEPEKVAVPALPLQSPGVLIHKGTFVWERDVGKKKGGDAAAPPTGISGAISAVASELRDVSKYLYA